MLANQPYYVVRTVPGTSEKFTQYSGAKTVNAVSDVVIFQRGRSVVVRYALNRTIPVSARLFNYNGRLVALSNDIHHSVGQKVMNLDLKRGVIASGEYVLRIVAGEFMISKAVMISK